MYRALFLKKVHLLFLILAQSEFCIGDSKVSTNRTIIRTVSSDISNTPANSTFFPSLGDMTTSIATNINPPPLNISTSMKKSDKAFTPSVHLGTIEDSHGYESRNSKRTNPFNNVQHFELGTSAVGADVTSSAEDDTGTVSVSNPPSVKGQVKYVYETDSGDSAHPSSVNHYDPNHHSLPQQTYEQSYVTVDVPVIPHFYYNNQDHQLHHDTHQQPQLNQHHHHHQYYDTDPDVHHIIYEKPSKHEDIKPVPLFHHHYEHIAPSNNEAIVKPEIAVPLHTYQHYYHDNQQNPEPHNAGIVIGKPETVLYLTSHHETSFTRTRKFPYKHYQPQDDTEIHLVKDEHAFPPQRRQISPWHKIIHIIGAFLPLGLLIAALKPPNVIKMNSNNTDPNIVLSKVRGIHLPIEHKELSDENEELCENKSICESVLRGAERNVKLIGNVLENFAMRSLKQNEGRKSEFNEILEAVRKRDCSFVKC